MHPLGTKNHATPREKKKYRNLFGQQITQPLGTKKNHAKSQDKKKSCNLSQTIVRTFGVCHSLLWSSSYIVLLISGVAKIIIVSIPQ